MQNTVYKNSNSIKYTIGDKCRFAVFIILIMATLYLIISNIILNVSHREFKPKEFDNQVYYVCDNITIDIKEAKKLCDEYFKTKYILIEKPLKNKGYNGKAIPSLGIIVIDNSLDGVEFAKTLVHEICHLKYYTANETYTEYMAFVELYETDNYILKQVALNLANEHCYYRGHYNTQYDVAFYINNYLGG